MRGCGGQCSWQLQGPLAAGGLAGHGLLRGHKPGVPAGLHKAWGRSWGECGRGATPHHVEAEVAPPAPSGSCVPSHRSPRAWKPWRHWDFRTQGKRRLHNERPEPRAAGARRKARADGNPRTAVGAPAGTQRALRRGREQGRNTDARAGQCRGGSLPLWRLRREVIWEARGERDWPGVLVTCGRSVHSSTGGTLLGQQQGAGRLAPGTHLSWTQEWALCWGLVQPPRKRSGG